MPAMAADASAAGRATLSAGSSFDALLFAASSQLEQPAGATQRHSSQQDALRMAGAGGRRPVLPQMTSQMETSGGAGGRASRKRRIPTPLEEGKLARQRPAGSRGPPPELLAVPTAATRRCQSLLSSAKAAIREAQELAGQTATNMSKLGWPPAGAALPPATSPVRGRGGARGRPAPQAPDSLLRGGAAPPPAGRNPSLGTGQRSSPQASPRASSKSAHQPEHALHLLAQLQQHEREQQKPSQRIAGAALMQRLQAAQARGLGGRQAPEPTPQHAVHGLDALGQQRSWPGSQLALPTTGQRQQQQLHEQQQEAMQAGLLQQLIAAGALGGDSAPHQHPTLQRDSAPDLAPAAPSLQMSRQRSLSNPELYSPPGALGGGRVARPVARRPPSLGRLAPQQQPQRRQREEPLPASAFEDGFGTSSRGLRTASVGGFGDQQPAQQQGSLAELLASAAAASHSQQQAAQAAAVQAALEALAAGQRPVDGAAALAAAQLLGAAASGHAGGTSAAGASPPRYAASLAAEDASGQLSVCPGCCAAKPATEFLLSARNAGRALPRCRTCCAAAGSGAAGGPPLGATSPLKPHAYRRSLSDSAAARQQQQDTLRRVSDETNTLQRLSNSSQLSALTSGATLHSSSSLSNSGSLHRGSQSMTSTGNAAAAAAAAVRSRADPSAVVGDVLAQWGAKRQRLLDPATAA